MSKKGAQKDNSDCVVKQLQRLVAGLFNLTAEEEKQLRKKRTAHTVSAMLLKLFKRRLIGS